MGQILLTALADALGGATPTTAVLEAKASQVRSSGVLVTAPADVVVNIKNGVPEVPVVLDESGVDWYWTITVSFRTTGASITRYVTVPAHDVEWADLVDIDPATMQPDPGAVPAWEAAVQQVQALIDGAVVDVEGSVAVAVDEQVPVAVAGAVAVQVDPKVQQAEIARDEAVAAKDAAEAVPTTNDGIMAPILADPETESGAELRRTFVGMQEIDLASFLLPGETMPDDGVADAYPLLQRAVTAVTESGIPATVRMPPGDFRINSSVRWNTGSHVGFSGAGRANTKIIPYGTAVFGYMHQAFDVNTFLDNILFADFTVDCSNQDGPINQVGIKGISLRYMRNGLFQRVRIINSWATSFGCDYLQDTSFVDCTAVNSGRGVTLTDTFGAGFGIGVGNYDRETVTFVNCYAIGAQSAGFFIERLIEMPNGPHEGRGVSLTGCVAYDCHNGVLDFGAHGLLINGGQFNGNHNAGIDINGGTLSGRHGGKDGRVTNAIISGNGVGVRAALAATGGYTFEGCDIRDNVGAGFTTTAAGVNPHLGSGWQFHNCNIEDNGAGGIYLGVPMVDGLEVVGCRIRNNGVGSGITILYDAIEPRITGNTIQGHIGAGINLPDVTRSCWDPFIQGNVLTENRDGGIVNAKITNSTANITGNRTQAAFTTLTNFFSNPTYAESVANVIPSANFSAPVLMTEEGDTFARVTVTAGGAGSAVCRFNRRGGSLSGPYMLVAEVRATKEAPIRIFAAGSTPAGTRTVQKGGIRATGDWQRVFVPVLLPVGSTQVDLNIALDIDYWGATALGWTLDVKKTRLVPGTALWPYWDGNEAPAAGGSVAWSSTVNNSPSVWTLPV